MVEAVETEPLRALPEVDVVTDAETFPKQLGPYRIDGPIARFGKRTIYAGHDQSLERSVWIHQNASSQATGCSSADIHRMGRCRWLQGGTAEIGRWDAYESIRGVPFSEFANQSKLFTWENTRAAITDFVNELATASAEGTLPDHLHLSQFWVQQNGQGKICDFAFCSDSDLPASDHATARSPAPLHQAFDRLTEIFQMIKDKQDVPASIEELIGHFQSKPRDSQTLSWLAGRLRNEQVRLPALKWDSRLGVLGITLGVEWVIYSGLIMFFTWLSFRWFGTSPMWKLLIPVFVFSGCFFAIGYLTRGAPVFRFMAIDVHHLAGQLASRFRCGCRHWLCWLPLIVLMVPAMLASDYAFAAVEEQFGDQTAASTTALEENVIQSNRAFAGLLALIVVAAFSLMVVGAIFSIASPRRGLPDYLLRTKLVPR